MTSGTLAVGWRRRRGNTTDSRYLKRDSWQTLESLTERQKKLAIIAYLEFYQETVKLPLETVTVMSQHQSTADRLVFGATGAFTEHVQHN
jgi:hypothetical protein